MTTPNTPVVIFAGKTWEASVVKSLLENAEIEAFLKDEFQGTLAPWNVTPGGSNAVKVVVSSSDAEKAKIVVDQYEGNKKG